MAERNLRADLWLGTVVGYSGAAVFDDAPAGVDVAAMREANGVAGGNELVAMALLPASVSGRRDSGGAGASDTPYGALSFEV